MKKFGISQRMEGEVLIIDIDNVGIRLMEKRGFDAQIDIYFETEIHKLTNEIAKLGAEHIIDYTTEVYKNGGN